MAYILAYILHLCTLSNVSVYVAFEDIFILGHFCSILAINSCSLLIFDGYVQ